MATRTKKNVKDSNANAEVKTEAAEVVAEAKPKRTIRRKPVKKQQPQAQASEAQPKEQPVKAQPKEQPVKAQPKERLNSSLMCRCRLFLNRCRYQISLYTTS